MKKSLHALLPALLVITAALVGVGCGGGSQTTKVEGYDNAMLANRRVAVLVPSATGITMSNPDVFAASRGVDAAGAVEAFHGELRTQLVDKLDMALDSNTVLDYSNLAVAGSVMLDASRDFSGGTPSSWDNLKRAGREGNLDYLVVLNRVSVANTPSSSGGRGDERVEAGYMLLDLARQKVMTSGTVSFTVSDPRSPANTWERLVAALTAKLPFSVVTGK